MKRKFSKLLALLMCMAMFVSILPAAAYAEGNEIAEAQTEQTGTTSTEEENPASAEIEQSEAAKEPLAVAETAPVEKAPMPEAQSLVPDENGNYTVSSFDELEALCALVEEGTGYNVLIENIEFVISRDLTIPSNVRVTFSGCSLILPEGVTLTLVGSIFLWHGSHAEIGGTIKITNSTLSNAVFSVDCLMHKEVSSLNVTGMISVEDNGTIDIPAETTGIENIHMNTDKGSLSLYYNIKTEAELISALEAANNDETVSWKSHSIYITENLTLTSDFVLEHGEGVYVIIEGYYNGNKVVFTIPEGVIFTTNAEFVVDINSAISLEGTLINNDRIMVRYGSISLAETGHYAGAGSLWVSAYSHDNLYDALPGFDLDAFDIDENWNWTLTLKEICVPGDITGDGSVDLFDLLQLKKHLAGDSSVSINAITADVTSDGIVDLFDLFRLKQHLAGMDVTLG